MISSSELCKYGFFLNDKFSFYLCLLNFFCTHVEGVEKSPFLGFRRLIVLCFVSVFPPSVKTFCHWKKERKWCSYWYWCVPVLVSINSYESNFKCPFFFHGLRCVFYVGHVSRGLVFNKSYLDLSRRKNLLSGIILG